MKIAVLSGKGGAGKTLVAVNLAAVAGESSYIDCDIEEPNGYLFFKPVKVETEEISVEVPSVNADLCNGCRACVDFCKFNALAYINQKIMIFEEVCHGCGGCAWLCPEKALSDRKKGIGCIQKGISENVKVITGRLNIGEASGVPIIKKMLSDIPAGRSFIDCPPGSACIVMESIRDADYCMFVAEPTRFGVHNLNMVYELAELFGKPNGVVLNKCQKGDNPAEKYCLDKGIKILGKIPFDKKLGTLNSDGLIAAREDCRYRDLFASLLERASKEVRHETAFGSQRQRRYG
ncbi:MAG: ATP-binding protein [Syntrophomonadaceae bacterium]|nr:ATP-binding protein [Syntrophomonadaceae bacterium]